MMVNSIQHANHASKKNMTCHNPKAESYPYNKIIAIPEAMAPMT